MSSTSNTRSTPKVSIEQASLMLKHLGVSSSGEFYRLCKENLRPNGIPARPDLFYKEKFVTWEAFFSLGNEGSLTDELRAQLDIDFEKKKSKREKRLCEVDKNEKVVNRSSSRKIPKVPMQQAAMILVALGVDSSTLLAKLVSEGGRPAEVPSRPDLFYKEEFTGWDDFFLLGKKGIESGVKMDKIPDYQILSALVAKLGVWSRSEYKKAIKDGRLPKMSPSQPDLYYLDDWTDWKDFLAPKAFYICFEEARSIARGYKFENRFQWVMFCREGNLPKFIPKSPDREYEEFTTWDDFLKAPS